MGWAGLEGGFWLRRLRVLIWGVRVVLGGRCDDGVGG